MALVASYKYLKDKIQAWNLFENIEKIEEEDLKNQRISTWIFLILLFLSIFSLLIYASVTSVTKTMVVQQPKIIVYKDLQSKYPNTLICPCQQILNEYSTFIVSFIAKFNQICSSDFISEEWLNYVNYRLLPQIQYHYAYDFRHSAYSFFQMLRTLCTLVSQTINDQLIQFYSTTLLTQNLVSEETFLATTFASKDQFLNMTASSFQNSLSLLRTIVQGNTLVNRLETNCYLQPLYYDSEWFTAAATANYPPDGCSCEHSSYCKTTTGIFTVLPRDPTYHYYQGYVLPPIVTSYEAHFLFSVTGINVGCSILDAVLQSDLSCLYNSSCLSQLNMYLNDSLYPFNATPLNIVPYSSLPTVGNLVEKLMVDEWIFNSSYESYFSQCNPLTCTYTYTKQFDILFIITTVMGSIGGIVTILMIVTLPLVTFTRRFLYRRRRSSVTQTEIDPENSRSLRQHFQLLRSKIKDFIINLNIFKDVEKQSVHDLRNQRISTSVFIVLMIITFSVLIVYTSLTIITQTVTVKKPTLNVYTELQTKYSQTLICPCTQITIDYEKFISFHPKFHQICSSDFITTKWIRFFAYPAGYLVEDVDLRSIALSYFSTLSAFCKLSVETIHNALFAFNSTTYVTKNVQQTDLFRSQTEQIVNLFKRTTTNSYLRALSMIREIFSGNALFSCLLTNYAFEPVDDNSFNEVFYPNTYTSNDTGNGSTKCSCQSYPSTCGQSTGIYTESLSDSPQLQFFVPGVWIGCYTIESLFESTFECYFNQSCLNKIYDLTISTSVDPFNATAMIYNASNTQYEITTKIQEIIEQLMIEQWNDQILFSSYYEQCNPVVCVYTYNKKGDVVYVFTTIMGLIGGLTTVLRIIIPPIIEYLRRKKRLQPIQTEVGENRSTLFHKYSQILKNYIIILNLFKNPNKRSNQQIRYQSISTRIFIILFSLSLIILLIYISLHNITQTITVKNPSIDRFNLLYQQYSDTLQCPCKTLSIEYQSFIQFYPQFHPICTSDFVTSKMWLEIDYSNLELDNNGYLPFRPNIDDFRQITSPLFQLLTSFCQLSLQTVNTELLIFNFTTFITPNLISQQQFHIQTSQIIRQFIENTARSFLSNLWLVNNMTSANMLISALSSDSILTAYPQYNYDYHSKHTGYDYITEYVYDRRDQIYNSTLTGSDCDCQENPSCIQQAVVYDLNATNILFHVPGIYVGCYLVEGLLQSNLYCFYDDLCLQKLIDSLQLSSNISTLSNSTSIYQVTTTLSKILSNLMIEQWNNETSYQDYFNQCQLDECSATYVARGHIPYIITTMAGLIGGLTKAYKFTVPLLVTIVFSVITQFKRKKLINNKVIPLETP